MKILSLFICLLPFLSHAAFNLEDVPAGKLLDHSSANQRARLFADAKPAQKEMMRLMKPSSPAQIAIEVTPEHELKFSRSEQTGEGEFNVAIDFAKTTALKVSFSIKFDNFFVKKSGESRFGLYIGGANLMFRGDTGDVRYFDVASNKYVRLKTLKNGEWMTFDIDLSCGEKPVCSINEFKNIPQRGKNTDVRLIQFSGVLKGAESHPMVTIKELKITSGEELTK